MGRPSKYPPEFRREAVELARASDRPRAEVARSLGLSDSTVFYNRERHQTGLGHQTPVEFAGGFTP